MNETKGNWSTRKKFTVFLLLFCLIVIILIIIPVLLTSLGSTVNMLDYYFIVMFSILGLFGVINIIFTKKVIEIAEKIWKPVAKDISKTTSEVTRLEVEEETILMGFGLFHSRSLSIWRARIIGLFFIGLSIFAILDLLDYF